VISQISYSVQVVTEDNLAYDLKSEDTTGGMEDGPLKRNLRKLKSYTCENLYIIALLARV